MNKIIKELLKQSDPSYTEDYNEDVMCALQRFAELIIRECARIAYESPAGTADGTILEYFGIEE